jgi:hypothetical protein
MSHTSYPIDVLSRCLGHAIHKGLSIIHFEQKDWSASRKSGTDVFKQMTRDHYQQEAEIIAMFPQLWGSTALGFGGIGGAAMTTAYSVVIRSSVNGEVLVYFNGEFAYRISAPKRNLL